MEGVGRKAGTQGYFHNSPVFVGFWMNLTNVYFNYLFANSLYLPEYFLLYIPVGTCNA